jgi:hypothetical protein
MRLLHGVENVDRRGVLRAPRRPEMGAGHMIGLGVTNLEQEWPQMTHYRVWDIGVTWRDIHLAPGVYDWARLDAVIAKAEQHANHILYTFGACPQWAAKYPNQPHAAPWLGPGSNSMPFDLDIANEFLWNLATRYRGRIHAYEIWNEPQLADFLYPWNDAERNALAQLTKRARNTIEECDPQALILAAAVLPRESSGGMTRGRKYWEALKAKGWPVDAFTCHIYPEVDTGYKRWESMLQDVVSTLGTLDPPTRKLWITETAYGLLGYDIPDAKADQLVHDTYAGDGGRFVYWYSWDRPDLGGMYVGPGSAAWSAINTYNTI